MLKTDTAKVIAAKVTDVAEKLDLGCKKFIPSANLTVSVRCGE